LRKNENKITKNYELYKAMKMNLLNDFYVGGQNINQIDNMDIRTIRTNDFRKDHDHSIMKRGRIWHGRPPVKIIERFD
jgi:hypothetical protein